MCSAEVQLLPLREHEDDGVAGDDDGGDGGDADGLKIGNKI